MATIQEVYIALFGRPADPEGYNFYVEATGNGANLDAVGSLANSPEYLDRFDGQTDSQKVNQIFQDLFGRSADAGGLEFYLGLLSSGQATIQDLAIRIADGATGSDDVVLANKVVAANRFTFSLDTEVEVAAYQGDDAADAGRAFLSGVTADTASIPTAAETDSAIGQLVGPQGVSAALSNLDAAIQAEANALEAIALADNANTGDTEAVREDAALDLYVSNYDDVAADAELSGAQTRAANAETAVLTAQATLATARAGATDAQLQANYATAYSQAGQNAPNDLAALLAARGQLATDVNADGTNVELLTDIRDAVAAYAAAGGNLGATVAGGTLTDLLNAINLALSAPDAEAEAEDLLADLDSADFDPAAAGNAVAGTTDTALDTIIQQAAERGGLIDAVVGAEGAGGVSGLVAAETAIEIREGQIEAVAAAQANAAAAQEYAGQIEALIAAFDDAVDNVAEAEGAFATLGFEDPIDLATTNNATTGNDIFLLTDGQDSIVTNFGAGGTDILFVGNDYTVVNIASSVNLSDVTGPAFDTAGSASVLEVFVQQVGGNTVLYFEDNAIEGQVTNAAFGGEVITLVGVDASDLTFNNGYFTIA